VYVWSRIVTLATGTLLESQAEVIDPHGNGLLAMEKTEECPHLLLTQICLQAPFWHTPDASSNGAVPTHLRTHF
jgi:hypothetical protein